MKDFRDQLLALRSSVSTGTSDTKQGNFVVKPATVSDPEVKRQERDDPQSPSDTVLERLASFGTVVRC